MSGKRTYGGGAVSEDRALRLEAGRRLGRALATPEFRKTLTDGGYISGEEIVLALDDDSVDDVMTRVWKTKPPTVIAVYRQSDDRLRIMYARPGESSTEDSVTGSTTIGMLFDYIDAHQHPGWTFKWNRATAPTQVQGLALASSAR